MNEFPQKKKKKNHFDFTWSQALLFEKNVAQKQFFYLKKKLYYLSQKRKNKGEKVRGRGTQEKH